MDTDDQPPASAPPSSDDQTEHRYHADPDEPLSAAVINAVAILTDTEPTKLPPLYDVLDPDGLDSLFNGHSDGRIEFSFEGIQVTAFGSGQVVVRPT